MKPAIIVHGGAWSIPEGLVEAHRSAVWRAALEGFRVLEDGGSALDGVEAAVNLMEEDPNLDAGVGSFLNRDGVVELDAMIMDGSTLRFGAVAAVRNVVKAISLARKVMEETEHAFLVGYGAERFAEEIGFETCGQERLIVERELELYQRLKARGTVSSGEFFDPRPGMDGGGTVGAVALDLRGNIAAGTSTGGSPFKRPGRVGDSPIIGCGAYADNRIGGASATGWGEALMRLIFSKRVVDGMAEKPPSEACAQAVELLWSRLKGRGGAIALNREGLEGAAYNTPRMAYAYMKEGMKEPIAHV
ncbi:MAG: isoaspartyl peptidase/L-asparaginase [Candidatus Bathyarchaeia archaeon]